MAEENGDFNLTVPQADISLEDIPATQEKVDTALEAALFPPAPAATRRAQLAHIFNKAKREGLAAVQHLWEQRWRPIGKRGPPDLFTANDLAQREWLIEQMAGGLSLFEACKKAAAEERVYGRGTQDSIARRLASRFDRDDMEAEASRNSSSCN